MQEPIQDTKKKFESTLAQMVELATVSSDPNAWPAFDAMVALEQKLMLEYGLDTEVLQTKGLPIVYGEYIGDPSWPTVLLYNHMDVQPADEEDWKNEPFKLTIRDDKYFGRGATDDKGPALTALIAIGEAIRNNVRLNFKIIWEHEEEIGSPNFSECVRQNASKLTADSVLVIDSLWVASDKPSIDYGLRGLVGFEISLQTAEKDVHSGIAGGLAVNPINQLAQIICECFDSSTGKILIPGFYDDVKKITDEETSRLLESGFSIEKFKTDNELRSVRTDDTVKAIRAISAEPTFEVHGIVGGHTGDGFKTIIPAKAVAKITCRLVPDQKPKDIFRIVKQFINEKHPDAVVTLGPCALPFITDTNNLYITALIDSYQSELGMKTVLIREGGSIGAVVDMMTYIKAPVIVTGLSLPEHGYHAINEYFDWQQASRGMKVLRRYFQNISANN